MSVNITVHGASITPSGNRNCLIDEKTWKQQEYDRRRKLRLEQVRNQSKLLASKLRTNVNLERRKNYERIEKTKAAELNKWREQSAAQVNKEFEAEAGGAHRAALRERCVSSRQNTDPKVVPSERNYSRVGYSRDTKKVPKRQGSHLPTISSISEENNENSSDVANIAEPSTRPVNPHIYPHVILQKHDIESSSSSSITESRPRNRTTNQIRPPNSFQPTEPKTQSTSKLTKTKPVIFEVDPKTDDAQLPDIEDSFTNSNILFSRIRSSNDLGSIPQSDKSMYNHRDYIGGDSSSESRDDLPTQQHFTQISDLIKRRQELLSSERPSFKEAAPQRPKSPQKHSPTKTKSLTKDSTYRSAKSVAFDDLPSGRKSSGTNPGIQFYDYFNKFEKKYEQLPTAVRRQNFASEPTAAQLAKEENDLQVERERDLKELRRRCEERSQQAIQREEARREYEALTDKLEALTKEKQSVQATSHDESNNFLSDSRLQRNITKQQKKMNCVVENILNRPVIITCPEITNKPSKESIVKPVAPQSLSDRYDINVGGTNKRIATTENSINSSDSCASILLDFVETKSKQVTTDIASCDNNAQIDKLKALFSRINELREYLLKEIRKCGTDNNNRNMERMIEVVKGLDKERSSILSDNKEMIKNDKSSKMHGRNVQNFSNNLERPKEIATQIENDSKITETESNESLLLLSKEIEATQPIKLIIKMCNAHEKDKKSPKLQKTPAKRKSLADFNRKYRPKKLYTKTKLSRPQAKIANGGTVQKQPIVQNKEKPAEQVEEKAVSSVENSTSTSYRSIPPFVPTKLSEFLKRRRMERNISQTRSEKPPAKKLDPNLISYIKRLLNMSRNSIEMLGVSSSEVDTPGASIINVSGNVSSVESAGFNQGQSEVTRLQQFISDNYEFLNKMNESMQSKRSSSDDSTLKTTEAIWLDNLKRKQLERKSKDKKDSKGIRPILKPRREETPPKQAIATPDSDKLNLVSKYTELTDNCTQRIAELTEMIDKVRQEKQKILEITLSSGTETGRNSTEYLDFAERQISKTDSNKTPEPKSAQTPADIEKVQLEKNKLTGMSRDSGISLSRPVTSLDVRESPDIRIFEKYVSEPQIQENYVPVLRDIPRITPQLLQIIPQTKDSEDEEKTKKSKPPVSLVRYSPNLVEEIPHELSTILEVETPATSRLQLKDSMKDFQTKKFLTFEEYTRQQNLDMTKFDPELSSKLHIQIDDDVKNDLQYQAFPSPRDFLNDDENISQTAGQVISTEPIKLSYKSFPSHREYAEKLDKTGLLDSRSIEASVSETSERQTTMKSSSTSVESLLDVMAELRRRNILTHSLPKDSNSDQENNGKVDVTLDDSLTGIEKELESMGLKWAGVMLRKSREKQKKAFEDSSTASSQNLISSERVQKKLPTSKDINNEPSSSHTIDVSLGVKPLDLKEFLARELQQRATTSSSSNSTSLMEDDSLAAHFLRSFLLGGSSSSSSNSTPKFPSSGKTGADRQRTSTPVVTRSPSSGKVISAEENSSNLFSGESRISSVRLSTENISKISSRKNDL